jgi:hypothetical protein
MLSDDTYTLHIKEAYFVTEPPLNTLSVFDAVRINRAAVFVNRDGPSHIRWHTEQGDVQQRMLWRRKLPYIESHTEKVSVRARRQVVRQV